MVEVYNGYFSKMDIEKGWRKTKKKQYSIHARYSVGEVVFNKLEGARYTTDRNQCIILRGTAGEEWVIALDSFRKKYVTKSGSPISDQILRNMMVMGPSKRWLEVVPAGGVGKNFTNYALFLDIRKYRNVGIATSWGTVLYANRDGVAHGKGDFLVCGMNPNGSPNFGDMWVVNGEIFLGTYSTVGFGGDSLKYVL